jgi:8-oxo-dGTP diphosphatase
MNNEITIVAVGVIQNAAQEVLIAKRPSHLHQGDLWEFPGGKVEENETVLQALKRELQEEINIEVQTAMPFMQVTHDYGDKQVLLDVWLVTTFLGDPQGMEGQPLCWVSSSTLAHYHFPAANQAIIEKLILAGGKNVI